MVDFQSRDRPRPGDDESDADGGEAGPGEPDADRGSRTDDGSDADVGLGFAVVTIADGRDVEEDRPGGTVADLLEGNGSDVVARNVIVPGFDGVQGTATRLADRADVDAIVTVGSTGVAPDAVALEALTPLFDKTLPGFGEQLRRYEHERIGSATIRDRSTAGLIESVPVFAVPDDAELARLATERLIVPEAAALVESARGGSDTAAGP